MPITSLGQVVPVLGPVLGFPGTVSRIPYPTIVARPVNSDATLNLSFGEAAVVLPDSTGGTWMSVADFLATPANLVGIDSPLSYFAGFAVREVKPVQASEEPKPETWRDRKPLF